MSHHGTGREPLSRDKRQNKKSLTSQYSFCLGHLVVEAQEMNHNFFLYYLVLECLFTDFAHAFDWVCVARISSIRLFFIIFNEIRKSINSQSESQYELIVPGLLGCFTPGSNFFLKGVNHLLLTFSLLNKLSTAWYPTRIKKVRAWLMFCVSPLLFFSSPSTLSIHSRNSKKTKFVNTFFDETISPFYSNVKQKLCFFLVFSGSSKFESISPS